MTDRDLSGWKTALFARRRVHATFAVLIIGANICYALGSIPGAGALFGLGIALELASWIALARGVADESDRGPRSGLQ